MSGNFAKHDSPIVRMGDSIVDTSLVCAARTCGDTHLLLYVKSQKILVSFESSDEQQEAFVLLHEKMMESKNGGRNIHRVGFLQRAVRGIWPS